MSISDRYPPLNPPRSSAQLEEISNLIVRRFEHLASLRGPATLGYKAAAALLPYAAQQEADGEGAMIDAFLGLIRSSGPQEFLCDPLITLFDEGSPKILNQVIVFVAPYVIWSIYPNSHTVTRWAVAILAVPYTTEVGESFVDTLLQIAAEDFLCPSIPFDVWALLKKQPFLPAGCKGREVGALEPIVHRVRELGDIEILKSYLLIIWLESHGFSSGTLTIMCASIREEFCGIGMGGHRGDLNKRLDCILAQSDRGLDHPRSSRQQYEELKEVLLEVDKDATEILTRTPSRLTSIFGSLTQVCIHRIPLDICLCAPTPVPIVVWPQYSFPVPPSPCFGSTRVHLHQPFTKSTYPPLRHLQTFVMTLSRWKVGKRACCASHHFHLSIIPSCVTQIMPLFPHCNSYP